MYVIISPVGSNIMLMDDGDVMEVADRYNDWGAAAFVLTFRLSPRYGENARVLDGKRDVALLRSLAADWKLDPNRIGFAGFPAGSSMARSVVAAAGPGDPAAADPIDRFNSRPDYAVLVYSPGRATPGEQLKNFPPTFLLAAAADKGAANAPPQFFIDFTKPAPIPGLPL